MKSIIARAFLGACILLLPASIRAGAEESVNTGGAPAVSLTDLGRMAEENIRKVEALIEDRRKAERKAALDADVPRQLGLKRPCVPVVNTRSGIGKSAMRNNTALPKVEVDPQTYEVFADGQLLTCEPAEVLPMAQRYFLL
jgi:hypothetical protein